MYTRVLVPKNFRPELESRIEKNTYLSLTRSSAQMQTDLKQKKEDR